MSRRSKALDALGPVDRERLDADLLRGDLSWAGLSQRYGIPASTLREYCARSGIVRNQTGLKRELVAAAMSRPDPAPGDSAGQSAKPAESVDAARAEIEAAAAEDVRDQRLALQCARIALSVVATQLQASYGPTKTQDLSPKDLKCLSECVAINVATVRLIRGLDTPQFTTEQIASMSTENLQRLMAGKPPI